MARWILPGVLAGLVAAFLSIGSASAEQVPTGRATLVFRGKAALLRFDVVAFSAGPRRRFTLEKERDASSTRLARMLRSGAVARRLVVELDPSSGQTTWVITEPTLVSIGRLLEPDGWIERLTFVCRSSFASVPPAQG